jgi:hypothetical protein
MDDGRGGQFTTVYNGSENTGDLSFLITKLTTGFIYRFRAYAINFNGESEPSQIAQFYVCTAPSGLTAPRVLE